MQILTNFAKVGIENLITAIGPQDSYRKLDFCNADFSRCGNCPNRKILEPLKEHGATAISADLYRSTCGDCKNVCRKYVYEKNLKTAKLSKNSIKFLLYLYFADLSGDGRTGLVYINDVADYIGCTNASLSYCMKQLEEYKYCEFDYYPGDRNHFWVTIMNYKNAFNTAAQGGKGFLDMDQNMLRNICNLDGLIAIRSMIRILCDTAAQAVSKAIDYSFSEFSARLPKYAQRPGIIKKCMESLKNFMSYGISGKVLFCRVHDDYRCKTVREAMARDSKTSLIDLISSINQAANTIDPEKRELLLSSLGVDCRFNIPSVSFIPSDSEISSMARLSVRYGLDTVKEVVISYYSEWVCNNNVPNSMEAVLTEMCRDRIEGSQNLKTEFLIPTMG